MLKRWPHVMSCWRFVRNHASHDPYCADVNLLQPCRHFRRWTLLPLTWVLPSVVASPCLSLSWESSCVTHVRLQSFNVFFELVVVTNNTRFGFFPLWKCQCSNVVAVPLCSACCILQCGRKGVEGRGGEGGTSSLLIWWQLDDILTCMLISHTIITVAAVQSALSLWTRVATSGFTWTASLPTSLTASLWEPVRWGHLFKYSAPLCLWRPRCRCPSPAASLICAGEAHHGTQSRRHPGSSSVRWSSTSSGQTR